ncbi:MAG: polyprenyl synthetase family protein [Planctomycetota bacterium]
MDYRELKAFLEAARHKVDHFLEGCMPDHSGFGDRLNESMRYSLFSGGKRLRPLLCLMVNQCLGGREEEAMPSACALEMVHTYSLIHDDLPAMDDDDFRRGRASCHKAFDEATAILAGDGLLTLAFEVIARATPSKDLVGPLVLALSRAAGCEGMVLGQMRDLEGMQLSPDLEKVKAIHSKKTASLISAAFQMGALCARASQRVIEQMLEAGSWIGLAFQVIDDILDIESTSEQLGKTAGKDLDEGKLTYPAVVGLDISKSTAREMTQKALNLLTPADTYALIRELATYMLHRTS